MTALTLEQRIAIRQSVPRVHYSAETCQPPTFEDIGISLIQEMTENEKRMMLGNFLGTAPKQFERALMNVVRERKIRALTDAAEARASRP